MMRQADRFYILYGGLSVLCWTLLTSAGWWTLEEWRARAKVDTLLAARTADVPELVHNLGPSRFWADPLLRAAAAQESLDEDKRLHVALALLPSDAGQADYLGERLLTARRPEEVKAIRELLHQGAPASAMRFWAVLQDEKEGKARRVRAACALAPVAADDGRWAGVGDEVVRCLAGEDLGRLGEWAELLEPVRTHLVPHQVRRLVEADAGGFAAFLAMLRVYPEEAVGALHGQLERTLPGTARLEDRQALAQQQAQAAAALLHLGRTERVWPLFHQDEDPTRRTYVIHRCAALGVDPAILARRLLGNEEQDPSVRQGLLLALGEYCSDQRAEVVRGPLVNRVVGTYQDDPDPGLHSAAEWLLRRWQMLDRLTPVDQGLLRTGPGHRRGDATRPRWYVNAQGQTFAVLPAPGQFEVGSPPAEPGRSEYEERRRVQIDYAFAVGLKLVTLTEFKRFRPRDAYQGFPDDMNVPIARVSWYDAAAYCNWLSEQDRIPKNQWCYEPNGQGEYAEGMRVRANYQGLSGYRLPRDAEWEYACRGGTVTAWASGSDEAMLGHYAWFSLNSSALTHSVGSLKPNGLGLFDFHGNVWQWCQDAYEGHGNRIAEEVNDHNRRVLRGGSFDLGAWDARSATRTFEAPTDRSDNFGFRVARTYR
jgi:formylglycine-generating enzyme required for sulfatase activity